MIVTRTSNATCGSTYLWMRNAHGDDPCKIASALLGKCESTGVYNVPSISSGLPYPPPSKQQANLCQCNTVAYSLMSACAICQGGTYPDFLSWTSNCSSALVEYYGYPNQSTSNLDVQTYAFLPLTSNNEFDVANAKAAATGPTIPSSSGTSASTMTFVPSTASTATASMPPTASPVSAASSSAMGKTLDLVITVVVGLTLLLGLAGFFLFSRYRRGHSYQKLQLPKAGVASAPPSKPRLQTQTQPQPYRNEAKVIERSVSLWTMILSNLGLRRSPARSNSSQAAPSKKIELPMESTSPPILISQMQTPIPTNKVKPPSVPDNPYQPMLKSPRPQPTRIDTLPVMQSINRVRPQSRRSYSDTLPASSSSRDVLPLHRAPEGVKNVPRPADFKIEDTPTTTDGYPTSWKRKKPPVRGDFNPEISWSMSLGSFKPVSTPRISDEDSDSVLLISRSGDNNFDIASITSKARSVARSVASKRSLSETSVDDSSRSMAGSSVPPVSPAVFNGYRDEVPDSIRYGAAESRRQLFPASVRAAGYTGLPYRNTQS